MTTRLGAPRRFAGPAGVLASAAVAVAALSTAPQAVPASAAPPSTFGTTIAAGGSHSVVLQPFGDLRSFGMNSHGQLGSTTNSGTFSPNPVPVAANALGNVTSVAAGGTFTLALTRDAVVYAFGDNALGQLGSTTNNGTAVPNPVPTKVAGLTSVVAVAAGRYHSLALRADGTVWAFGDNAAGQLGNGVNTGMTTANPAPTLVPWLGDVVAISAGDGHSVALKRDGTVWTFGDNRLGQLGIASTSGTWVNSVPSPVPGIADAVAVAAGERHTLVLRRNGTVWSFGHNASGQLGIASTSGSVVPNPVAQEVPGIGDAVEVAAGGSHSVVRRADGTVWAFGDNSSGQTGAATFLAANPTPAPVAGIASALAISAGGAHTLVLRADGAVLSFGGNYFGQIGTTWNTATNNPNPAPVTVAGASPAAVPQSFSWLRVLTDPAVPSQIRIDTVPADTWGTWVKLAPAGIHQICFSDVPGYLTPPCQLHTTPSGSTRVVTGTFVRLATLRVVTSPALPSTVSVDGVPRNDWGVWTDLPAGSHEVCFGPVAGWSPPGCQQVTLVAGQTSVVTGSFTANSSAPGPSGVGMLRVSTSPALPSQVVVDGEVRDTWGAWFQLPPGPHSVCFRGLEGWLAPDCTSATVVVGETTSVTGTFTRLGSLRVITSPPVPGTISVDGVVRNDWGMWTDLPAGTSTVCFGDVPGRVAPPCRQVTLAPGVLTTVTGTYG